MATYYVDGGSGTDSGAGGTGAPWRTLNYALGRAATGDTIKVRTATYYEELKIDKGVTFEADTGHSPVIDGRYSVALFGDSSYTGWTGKPIGSGQLPAPTPSNKTRGNWVIAGCQTPIVQLAATNAALKGFTIRNVAGKAVLFAGNSCTLEDVRIDFTYAGAVLFQGNNCVMRDTVITRASVKYFDPTRFLRATADSPPYCGGGPEAVQTAVVVKGNDNLIEGCTIAYNTAEGLGFDKGGARGIIRDCTIHSNLHWQLGINGHRNARIERVTLYYCPNILSEYGKTKMPTLLTMGDENPDWRTQGGPTIINCLFVGGDTAINVGNGRVATDSPNYWPRPFQFQGAYIGYCTFVSLPTSLRVANFGVDYVYKHTNSVWENCIFYKHPQTERLANAQSGWGTGCTFRNNLSNVALPNVLNLTDGNIVTSAATMNNPTVVPTGVLSIRSATMPDPTNTTFNVANYDLVASSPAVGRSSDPADAAENGLTLPGVTTDRYKAARTVLSQAQGRYFDIGADEYGGVVTNSVQAAFTQDKTRGNAPLTVQFTEAALTTGAAEINVWGWAFGDGGTSTQRNPTHVYSAAGTYQVTLTVQDTVRSLTSTWTGPVITVGAPPVDSVTASFTRTPASGTAPLTVQFTDTSEEKGAAVINTRSYDFGDGATSTATNPTHEYTAAGTYRATLTVQDTVRGLTHTWQGPAVTVEPAAPDEVDAAFTQSATGGQAPLSVTFTDASTDSGSAAIDEWRYAFGDGTTSTSQNPTHVYNLPGVYTPTLTVRDTALGLVDSVAGSAITVTAAGEASVIIRQTRAALNTSDGPQTFSQAGLGGLIPKSARFLVTAATADGTVTDGGLFGYGWVTGESQQAACAVNAGHGLATTNAARKWVGDACLLIIDADGAEVGRGTFTGFTADGVTIDITWTGTPAAYLVTVVMGAGADYEAWVGPVALGNVGSTADVTGPGFAPDVARFMATWGAQDTAEVDATINLGLAARTGGAYTLERRYRDGRPDTEQYARLFEGNVLNCRYTSGGRAAVTISDWDAQGFTLRVNDYAINSTAIVMAERFGGAAAVVGLADSATATGNTDYTTTWNPQYAEHLVSQLTALGSANDVARAGTIGVHTVTDDGEYTNVVSGENAAATSNEQGVSDNRLVVISHTGTDFAAGATTLGTGKYTVNYTTAPATAAKWPYLAVEEGTAIAPSWITAAFSAAPLSGQAPLTVQFTDLSAGSSAVTGWAWDFGDGTTSTEQHPAHTYGEEGQYTVTLTVSDGTLSDDEVLSEYVVVYSPAKRRIIVGPYLMRRLTETSEAGTNRDPDEPDAGTMRTRMVLGGLRLSADGETPGALPDEVVVWYSAADDDLKVTRPDGTTGAVNIT